MYTLTRWPALDMPPVAAPLGVHQDDLCCQSCVCYLPRIYGLPLSLYGHGSFLAEFREEIGVDDCGVVSKSLKLV